MFNNITNKINIIMNSLNAFKSVAVMSSAYVASKTVEHFTACKQEDIKLKIKKEDTKMNIKKEDTKLKIAEIKKETNSK